MTDIGNMMKTTRYKQTACGKTLNEVLKQVGIALDDLNNGKPDHARVELEYIAAVILEDAEREHGQAAFGNFPEEGGEG